MFGLRRIQCVFFAHRFFAITLPSAPNVHQSDVSFSDLHISDLSHCHIPTRRFPPTPLFTPILESSTSLTVTSPEHPFYLFTALWFVILETTLCPCSTWFSPSKAALNGPPTGICLTSHSPTHTAVTAPS